MILAITILIALYKGIKKIIARIDDDHRRYVALKVYKLNVCAIVPCLIASFLTVFVISDRQSITRDDLETIGLTREYYFEEGKTVNIIKTLENGVQIYSFEESYNNIDGNINIMKNGDLVVSYSDLSNNTTWAEYINPDGTPVSKGKALYYKLFDASNYPYPFYISWGCFVLYMIAVNRIGLRIYRSKAASLTFDNDLS